jgi:hypothetical protein
MSKTNLRYYVFSKKATVARPLKNVATREEARDFKRKQKNPTIFGIYDRHSLSVIR